MLHKIAIYVTNIRPGLRPRSQRDKTMIWQARFAGWWLILTALAVVSVSAAAEDSIRTWTFDADLPGTLPKNFVVGTLVDGRPAGEWKVLKTDRAKSPPQVLAQLMGKGFEHAYKVVLINGINGSDMDIQVSFLPIGGKADMGGGLIWRAADDRNYYLTRANPLEQNIRIYRVVKGIRHLSQNFDQTIHLNQWHTLHVVSRSQQGVSASGQSPTRSPTSMTFSSQSPADSFPRSHPREFTAM